MGLISGRTALVLVAVWFFYHFAKATYNVFFHPLRHIPGPLLARASYAPEFYYDLVLFGRYGRRIEQMHRDFGPLVRISPNEVHWCDTKFIDEIYASGSRKRDKPLHLVRQGGTVMITTFSTTDHDLHRLRRGATSKFFSRAQVTKLEPTIHDLAARACNKIVREAQEGPFDVTMAYSMFTTDVISGYCFGESLGLVDQKGFVPNFRTPLYMQLQLGYYFRFFPNVMTAALNFAARFKLFPKDMAAMMKTIQEDLPEQIRKTRRELHSGTGKSDTIFASLLESDLPASEKSDDRLSQEANTFFAGGTETASWLLSVVTYHLLTKPAMLARLTDEVNQAVGPTGSIPSWSALEKLPYLTSVIYEGLRLSYGVAARSSRVATGEDLIYRGKWTPSGGSSPRDVEYVIPRGYAMGTAAAIVHHDESMFPDSHTFEPGRWLDENNQHRKDLDHALMAFSRGSRVCVGMNLAWCEIYIMLATLIVRIFPRMKLYETTELDVAHHHEMFISMPLPGSNGVRATVT